MTELGARLASTSTMLADRERCRRQARALRAASLASAAA
jgi:hypothetical protein